MNKNHQILLTLEGFKELKKEYEELVKTKRPKAVVRVTEAREAGDLTENSEYSAAREDLAFIDGRILEIKEILNGAKTIIKRKKRKTSEIEIGCKVYLHINGKKEAFTIVGEWEANPSEKKISHKSPLGKALLGKKVGESVEIEAPAGRIQYKVLKIE